MAGEKRFGSSFFGFKKSDVNYYIEKILKEFDDRLKEKDSEIDGLKLQNRDLKSRYDELIRKMDQVSEDRAKIAEVLIKANDKAELIIGEARSKAYEEKKELEEMIENQRETLVDLKQKVKSFKKDISATLRSFDSELELVLYNEAENEAAPTDEQQI